MQIKALIIITGGKFMGKIKWYILAACIWICVFPVTAITAWAFMLSGPFVIIAIILKTVLILLGIDVRWMKNSSFNLGVFPDLIIAIAVGALLTILGLMLWKLTKRIYKWLNNLNKGERTLKISE